MRLVCMKDNGVKEGKKGRKWLRTHIVIIDAVDNDVDSRCVFGPATRDECIEYINTYNNMDDDYDEANKADIKLSHMPYE